MKTSQQIDGFLKELKILWLKCPDLRFFQVIELIRQSKTQLFPQSDLFYVEDEQITQKMTEIVVEIDQSEEKHENHLRQSAGTAGLEGYSDQHVHQ